jgi:signal transduction histidine kinase
MSRASNMDTWMRRSALRGLSIHQRVPLLISILLICAMVSFSWISYIGVKKASLKSGYDRLNTLTEQLSNMLAQSMQGNITITRTTASSPIIKQCLQSLEPHTCTEALLLLEKSRQDSTTVMVQLLDPYFREVLHSSKGGIETRVNFDSLNSFRSAKDTGAIGKIYRIKDSMYYPTIIPVTDNNKIIGYIAKWRSIGSSPDAIDRLSQLLGAKARLYLANADRSLWTDMVKPISNPVPENAKTRSGMYEYSHGKGNRVIATEKPIKNSPWVILIEFSEKTVLEPASSYLQWITIIASILVCIGIFITWILSRNITRPLDKLTAAVSLIASGNDSPAVAIDRRDEVGKLARAFNAMTVQVRNAKNDLEKKVIEQEQMNEQLRNLSAHLQNIREQERIHIAREMHDELGQLLTGFKMDVSWLKKRYATDDPAIKEKLTEMESLINDAVSFVRKIAAELRPSILDDLGLIPALEWQSKEFQKRFGIEVEFQPKVQELHTTELIATGLFRMYQESLTNVARHSGATKVQAVLNASITHICLSIADNGKGFDIDEIAERKTLGLLGMKERAVMIGGNLDIKSGTGEGTTVSIKVPKVDD